MKRIFAALFIAELVSLTNANKLILTEVSPAGDEDEVTEVVNKVDSGETVPIVSDDAINYAED